MLRILFPLPIALMAGTCLLLVSCGKKAETKDGIEAQVIRPSQTALDNFLEKQDVNCEPNKACPNFITKIVIVNQNKYEFCTGILTEDDVVATSSSCLPETVRLNGLDCSQDVFFFFPKTANRPAERINCSKVLQVSRLEGEDPVLWRDDLSFLQLAKPSERRTATFSRDGVQNKQIFTTWMIDQQDEFSAIIKRSNCESIHETYVNPLVMNESSPGMLFADCASTNGSLGAPVVDNNGKVRAIISKSIEPKLRSYLTSTGLLQSELKPMVHATNMACASTPTNNEMLDMKECLKDLTYQKVDRLRSEMLSTNLLFGELRKKYEESLVTISKFVSFGVKLITKGDTQEARVYPKCFKPLDNWLSSMTNRNAYVDGVKIPVRSFRRTMDSYGKIQGQVIEDPEVEKYIQFSPKNLKAVKESNIFMWITGAKADVFEAITDKCSSLL
jgi:hypothetical protein